MRLVAAAVACGALAAGRVSELAPACVLHPPVPVAGAFGAAVSWAEGRLWVGPARDWDVGVGPPQVWALSLAADSPCTVASAECVHHPARDGGSGFGQALAAHGTVAVVGAPHAGCAQRQCAAGEAWLVQLHTPGPAQLTELQSRHPQAGAGFGAAVAIGKRWIAVGAPAASDAAFRAGAVEVFERVHAPPGREPTLRWVARIASPDPQSSARFGAAVAIGEDTLAVGEPGWNGESYDEGRVHIYMWQGEAWRHHSTLRASAGAMGWHGASLALAGEVLLAGAPNALRASGSGTSWAHRGSVVQYRRRQGQWRVERVVAPARQGHGFGSAIALDASTGLALVGASADSSAAPYGGGAWVVHLTAGEAWPLHLGTVREHEGAGAGVALAGDVAIVGLMGPPESSPPPPGRVLVVPLSPWRPPSRASSPRRVRTSRRHPPWRRPRSPRSPAAASNPAAPRGRAPPGRSAARTLPPSARCARTR